MTASFNPMPQFSYGDEWERTRARQQRNNQPYERIQQLSDQQAMLNASKAGDGLKALTQFSSALLNKVVENQKKKNEEDRLTYLNKGFEEGWEKGLLEDYSSNVEQLKEDKEFFDQTAEDLRAQGVDFEAVQEVEKMNPWQTYGYAQGLAKAAAERYPSWVEEQMMNNDTYKVQVGDITFTPKNAQGLSQKRAALSALRTEFLRYAGISGLNPGLLEESAFKQMRKDEGALMTKYKKAYRRDEGFKERTRLLTQFDADLDLNNALQGLKNVFDDEGESVLGLSGAWEVIEKHLEDKFETGMSEEDLDKIKSQIAPHTGKTYEDSYPTKFARFEELRANQETKNLDDDLANQKAKGKEVEREWNNFVMKQRSQGEDVTDAHLEETRAIYKSVTGQEADFLKDFQTREDMDDIQARKDLDKIRKDRGYLIAEDLVPYSSGIYKEYTSIVQEDSKLADKQAEEYRKKAKEIIKGIADQTIPLEGFNKSSPEYAIFKQNAEEDFETLFKVNLIDNLHKPGDAYKLAMGDVLREAEKGKSSKYMKGDFTVNVKGTLPYRQSVTDSIKFIGQNPTVNINQRIPGLNNEYIEQAVKYRDLGGEVPIFWKAVASKLQGVEAHDLMNGQLKANDLTPINKPQVEIAVDLADPDFQRLLRIQPTPISIEQANVAVEEKLGINEQGYDSEIYLIPGLIPPVIESDKASETNTVSGEIYQIPGLLPPE